MDCLCVILLAHSAFFHIGTRGARTEQVNVSILSSCCYSSSPKEYDLENFSIGTFCRNMLALKNWNVKKSWPTNFAVKYRLLVAGGRKMW